MDVPRLFPVHDFHDYRICVSEPTFVQLRAISDPRPCQETLLGGGARGVWDEDESARTDHSLEQEGLTL